jgi:hypothetical protein
MQRAAAPPSTPTARQFPSEGANPRPAATAAGSAKSTAGASGVTADGRTEPRGKKRKGTIIPRDSCRARKIGNVCVLPDLLVSELKNFLASQPTFESSEELQKVFVELFSGSLASRTWKKYASACKKWSQFCLDRDFRSPVPFSSELGLTFACWCKSHTSLGSSTISQYFSALKKLSALIESLGTDHKEGGCAISHFWKKSSPQV